MSKTIIILTPGFPKDEHDSTWVPPVQVFVKVLKETYPALKVIVISFQYPHNPGEYSWNGVNVIAIGGKGRGKVYRAITWLRVWRALKKINKQQNVIGLLSFWLGECALIGDRFARRHNLKHYCWMQGQDAKANNRYINRIKPTADNLIALSDFIRSEFKRNYGIVPKHLVPGAIDASLFKEPPATRDIDIMGAGSLISLKQYKLFIEVVGRLKLDFPCIKAVICGEGVERHLLQRQIDEHGLQNNITLPGELPHPRVLELMQRSKVFLHTSNYEGFGLVCLEALYAGARVISFVKPMEVAITNWHIAEDKYKMYHLAAKFLTNKNDNYNCILPYTVSDNAKKIMDLFDQQEAAIA